MRFLVKKPVNKTFEAVRRELSDVQAIVHHLLQSGKKGHALSYLRQTMEQLPDPPYWRAQERLSTLYRGTQRWKDGQSLPTMAAYQESDHPQYQIQLDWSVLRLTRMRAWKQMKEEAKPASELQ